MPEKDPTTYPLVTYAWVTILSAWGGIVSFIRKRQAGHTRPFNIVEFIGELVTSALSGIITFWLCEWSGLAPLLTASLVAISGHMGSRALFQFEQWAESKLPMQRIDQ